MTDRVWGTLLALTLARVAFGYEMQTVASVAAGLISGFGLAVASIGTLIGLYFLPGAFVAFPFGVAARRFGDRPVILGGLLLMTLGSAVSAVAPSPTLLGLGRIVAGAGAVALTVLQAKLVADRFSGRMLVIGMGIMVSAFPAGVAMAQLTQPRLASLVGWPAAFWAGSAVSAAALLLMAATWHEAAPVGRVRGLGWPSRRECTLVLIAGLMWTTYNAGFSNFLGYMPLYLSTRHVAIGHANLIMSAATWLIAPSILLGGAAAGRWGMIPVFVVGAMFDTVATLGAWAVDAPLLWAALFGLFANCHASPMLTLGSLSTRPENRAVGMALFFTMYYGPRLPDPAALRPHGRSDRRHLRRLPLRRPGHHPCRCRCFSCTGICRAAHDRHGPSLTTMTSSIRATAPARGQAGRAASAGRTRSIAAASGGVRLAMLAVRKNASSR